MIYDQYEETMPRDEMEQLQIEKLQAVLNRVERNVAFYRSLFSKNAVQSGKIKTVRDLQAVPFTTKNDLKESYPYDLFAVPLRDIVRLHSTSGTTGKPLVVGYTKNDINTWTHLVARVLTAAGVTEKDVIQIAFHYCLTTGGFGFHYGAERIGASVIPSSLDTAERQITIMKDYKTTVLASTPGFALHIAGLLEERGMHPESLFLRTGLFGSEPWSNNLRSEIEDRLHITAFDNYGLTEIIGPGVAFECSERRGLHVNEDHFIVEIIDPVSLDNLPDGEKGELVFTTLSKEGFPLIRYRTGDISMIIPGPCPCGRTTARIERVAGRNDDMVIVEGVNVFPSQIEEALLEVEGTAPHYQLVLNRRDGMDALEVRVEIGSAIPDMDETGKLLALKNAIETHIQSIIGIAVSVVLVEPKSLVRSNGGKIKRLIDNRMI